MNNKQMTDYQKTLEQDLIKLYGVVVSGEDLIKVLGFSSKAAFRQALAKGQISIPIFNLENRRGKYAMSKDLAELLTHSRFRALEDADMN